MKEIHPDIIKRAKKIKLVLTDCDGVLTDTGTYYTVNGETMKRFSIRDGMGVERLKNLADVETGIVTGENTDIVKRRAEKLKIEEVHLGIKDKVAAVKEIMARKNLTAEEIAFIGDDTNDVDVMQFAGFAASPFDATEFAKAAAHLIVENKGGHGAFRDLAEIIIASKGFK